MSGWRALVSNVCIGGTLCGGGDLMAQFASGKGEVERRRLGAMCSYGAVAAVPYHGWYIFLARNFPNAVGIKTVLECLVVLPVFEIPAMMLWTGILGRQQTPTEAVSQLTADFWSAFGLGCCVWGPASVFTFRFVPSRWHLTTFYSIGALWDFGMSLLAFDIGSAHAAATTKDR